MKNLTQTKDALAALAQQFRSHNYKSLNESQVRKSFIDEFWNILGWNTSDIRQVQVETRVGTKKPDYRFLVQNKTAFFVEAKKPSEDLMKNTHHIFQAKSYCWSGNVPLVVLTDFEEFRPFKCVHQPDKDKPKDGIIKQLDMTFEQYADRAEELLLHFSYESVTGGSLTQLLQLAKVKDQDRVDRVFLKQLAEWRKILAEKAALVNDFQSSNELAEAVQRILDRLVFLRILQDRTIEEQDHLRTIANTKKHAYKAFVELCQGFSHTYNGLIFNPHPLSESITIHDLDFKPIVKELLPDESPYRFDEIPVEVLGTIYERFLGDEIILQGRSAIVETKPDVRKAGGVYYTPQYIVEYIVNNTVGTLLAQCKTPKDVAALTICDPACGSGSFLLGAFDALIAWHEQYFEQHPEEWKEKSGKSFIELAFRDSYNKVRLTAEQKGRIAKNNLYGVDLDRQATEVTQMSLYIKILESIAEEPSITIGYRNAILPKLSDNIKHGNSLVDVDYYDMFPAEEHNAIQEQVHPFHWKYAFPHVFKQGGFDAVIGNPPWLMAGYYINNNTIDYYNNQYVSAKGKYDLYYCFIEKSFNLLKSSGELGFITPNKFFHTKAAQSLRNFIKNTVFLKRAIDFGDVQLFDGATNYSAILFCNKILTKNIEYFKVDKSISIIDKSKKTWEEMEDSSWSFENKSKSLIFKKIKTHSINLSELVHRFGTGVQTGADKVYCMTDSEVNSNKIETSLTTSIIRGRDVRKYSLNTDGKKLLFPYNIKNNEFTILGENELKSTQLYKYMLEHQDKLSTRIWFGKNAQQLSGKWYGLMYVDSYVSFNTEHLLSPCLSNKSNFTLGNGSLFMTGTAGVVSIIPKQNIYISIKALLAILNSSLINFYIINNSPVFSGGYYKFSSPYLKKIPVISKITKENDLKLSGLVDTMLELHKTKQDAVGGQLEQIEQRISFTDEKINRLVYELYELTEEEIRIVEGV